MSISTLNEPAGSASANAAQRPRAIYNPMLDFLLLGGGSLIVLPFAALIPKSSAGHVLAFSFWLSFAINFPHFAHSYQIFYRDFANKLRGHGYAQHLRFRYAFAGLAVPVLIAAIFALAYASGSPKALGLTTGAMAFFVGWHYVKQGYGILIVDSVFRRGFFNETEKKIFRLNAYASWVFFFLLTYYTAYESEYIGLKYYVFPTPLPLLAIAGILMLAGTAAAIWSGVQAARRTGQNIPWNGYVAYASSLYIWLGGLLVPVVLSLVPAFHSLQYLAIVWKYEINREKHKIAASAKKLSADTLWIRFASFVLFGSLLGASAFIFIPVLLDASTDYDRALFGSQMFTFMFFIFINIHHYFLDNVMWRKDNPDVGRHLFGRS